MDEMRDRPIWVCELAERGSRFDEGTLSEIGFPGIN